MRNQSLGAAIRRQQPLRASLLVGCLVATVMVCLVSRPARHTDTEPVEGTVLKDAFTSGKYVAVVEQIRSESGSVASHNTPTTYRTLSLGKDFTTVIRANHNFLELLENSDGTKLEFHTNNTAYAFIAGQCVRVAIDSSSGMGSALQLFHDTSGFAVSRETCGPLWVDKYAFDGRLLYNLRGKSHAHAWGILAPKSAKLCLWIFQHTTFESAIQVFDWRTGKKLKSIILERHRQPNLLAIDAAEKYIYIGTTNGQVERGAL